MDRITIPLKKLLLDVSNPRFSRRMEGQSEALAILSEGRKTYNLAKDVAEWGLSKAEQLIVMADEHDAGFYVALEGNRRLAAVKLLDNPDLAASDAGKKKFTQLASKAKEQVPTTIEVVVAKSRDEADHWIRLKHGGELDGVGAVQWNPAELARYNRLQGRADKNMAALDILDRCAEAANLKAEQVEDFPLTTLQRVIDTAHVKHALGLKVDKGQLMTNRPTGEVDQVFTELVRQLGRKEKKVDDLKTATQISGYITEKIRAKKLALKAGKSYAPLGAPGQGGRGGTPPAPGPRPAKPRKTFAPRKFTTTTDDQRLQKVVKELRKLRIDKFPNAGIGLFRMFLEMSAILYEKRHRIARAQGQPLGHGLSLVLQHLLSDKKLETYEAKPVRVLINAPKDHPWSLDTIQSALHNPRYSLSPDEMIQRWDELEPFLSAMCDGTKR